MKKPEYKVRINRNRWSSGYVADKLGYTGENKLYIKKYDVGCCLGHAICQIDKIPLKELEFLSMPQLVANDTDFDVNPIFIKNNRDYSYVTFLDSDFSEEAAELNDRKTNKKYTQRHKERDLIRLFKEQGIELSFFGKFTKKKKKKA